MKNYNRIASLFFLFILNLNAQESISVRSKQKPNSEWIENSTRTIDRLPEYKSNVEPLLDQFDGRKDRSEEAKGFFYTKKINDRWWIIDPEGNLFIHKGVVTVRPGTSEKQIQKFNQKFGNQTKWLDETVNLLTSNGFNGTGNWSDAELLKQSSTPICYTRGFNFMAAYGKKRGGTFQQPGHTGYPNDLIFVFDPEFEKFCDIEAGKAVSFKDEKNLLGYFSDNEMPFPEDALNRYLQLDKKDYGYLAAEKWLIDNKGKLISSDGITDSDREKFLGFMSARYFELVSKALKKSDPNHMYLGCRFYGKSLKMKSLFESAGKFMDIISVNYYNVWTPKLESLSNWSAWSGKPVIITEWYTKAEDSGMGNETGAGWIVPTQKDRGLFYQNYVLALLESKVCVGWHWFKYQDNDPTDRVADPSNLDSNKGIVNGNFEPYPPLLDEMKKINTHVYSLIDYFDKAKTSDK